MSWRFIEVTTWAPFKLVLLCIGDEFGSRGRYVSASDWDRIRGELEAMGEHKA